MKRGGAGIVLVGCVLLAAWAAPDAMARKINVHPGKNAIQKAINQANDGDELKLHKGHYRGGFVIDKALKLRAAVPWKAVIDGHCRVDKTITVAHDGVVLRFLKVKGSAEGFGPFPSEIYFEGIESGRVKQVRVKNTCNSEYGINVFQSGHLKLTNNEAAGFTDAGIYIGGITDTGAGTLRAYANALYQNNRGIIVEDSAGGRVRIEGNAAHDNLLVGEGPRDGIFLTNSDGVLIENNFVDHNPASGLHLDSNSDSNVLEHNTALNNDGPDFLNEGTDNCGSTNIFDTTAGNPLVPC